MRVCAFRFERFVACVSVCLRVCLRVFGCDSLGLCARLSDCASVCLSVSPPVRGDFFNMQNRGGGGPEVGGGSRVIAPPSTIFLEFVYWLGCL